MKIIKFGTIYEKDGELWFENFHIDAEHKTREQPAEEYLLEVVIEYLQKELDKYNPVREKTIPTGKLYNLDEERETLDFYRAWIKAEVAAGIADSQPGEDGYYGGGYSENKEADKLFAELLEKLLPVDNGDKKKLTTKVNVR